MKTQQLTLKAVSPLALHRRRASEQFAPSLDYLPGSAVRGAVADLYLQGDEKQAQDEFFQRLFLRDEVTFSDFLPAKSEAKSLSRLLPLSAMECKRFGDTRDTKHPKHESLTDSLLRLELATELDESDALDLGSSNDPLALGDWKTCPECRKAGREKSKRDRAETGYYTSVGLPDHIKTRKRMIAGAAIERATGTAADSMLFSHEVIEESSSQKEGEQVLFRGLITLPDDLYDELNKLIRSDQLLAVGYGRSRGLGQLVRDWEETWPDNALPERWTALNQTARDLWAKMGRAPQGAYFTVTLQSHLILRNKAGEPVLGDVTAADLNLPAEFMRRRSILSATLVSGWNAAQNLPKPDVWVLGRGSVLLFRLPAEVDPASAQKQLMEMEREGLGERRAEGFGRVRVCDEFHYYFLQKELKGVSR
jgi:CRISPR-associated protein Csx10